MSSTPVRILLLACAAAAVLSGCKRREAEAPPAPPPATAAATTPAEAGAPMAYESKNQFAEVKLALPEAIKAQPDLHAQLYAAGVRDLRTFVEGSQADRTEAGGDESQQPYTRSITITPAAETGKLVSLRRLTEEYTGGAHGNTLYSAVLWDKAIKRQLSFADLFRRGADLGALNRALCEAINVARKARGATDVITLGEATSGWACLAASEYPFVLAAGNTPGKAGGLTFLIEPYRVDAYANGAYEITLPQAAFRSLLAPAYADEFAGAPLKAGDVTPQY